MANPLEQAFQGILSGGKYSVKGTSTKPAPVKAKPKPPASPSGHFMNSTTPKNNGKAQPDPGGDLSHWTPPFPVRKSTQRYSK